MRRLLNTLFVLSENAYLSLDGENVVVSQDRQETARFALHTLEGILCFSYAGASPALMGGCAERGISLAFFTPRGRFLARIAGETRGNVLLRQLGFIAAGESLPFFTDPTWARVTVILINIWVGVPYTLLQLTGVLQNIPADLYEAATVDGANAVQTFFRITLPYMFYVTTPYLIATFTSNVNNFNVIYLLSGGDPVTDLASTAGSTDLLVTWLYKLTIDKQYYNVGAVVGILTFIILAIGSLLTYRRSKSYREEGGI